MKIKIMKDELLKFIQPLITVVPSKNVMPILTNFLIDAKEDESTVNITTTDLAMSVSVEISANVIESGTVAVSAKNFTEIINSLPDKEIDIFTDNEFLRIECYNSNFNLISSDYLQFPLIPKLDLSNSNVFPASQIKKMISLVDFAVANDTKRAVFNGVSWTIHSDRQVMVATDGKKIAEATLIHDNGVDEQKSYILSTKTLSFLAKIISTEEDRLDAVLEEKRVMFHYKNYTIFSHLLTGAYPDYNRAIPTDHDKFLTINRHNLIAAVKRVSLMASFEIFSMRFEISDNELKIFTKSREQGEAKENIPDIKYEGDELTIAFNYKYLLQVLNVMYSDEVIFRFKKSKTPVLIFNKDEKENFNSRFLLMPLNKA
jgi:DNA polymerase-3 subunit beta